MGLKVTIAPTSEPVTLEQAKAQIRETGDASDVEIQEIFIPAARRYCEKAIGRSLMTQSLLLTLCNFPSCGGIPLRLGPVQSITQIQYLDTSGNLQTLSSTAYQLVNEELQDYIVPSFGNSWPSARVVSDSVKITYVAGVDDASNLDSPLILAMLLIIANAYANREASAPGTINEIPFGAECLLSPYRAEGIL